jgi:plastocyanin
MTALAKATALATLATFGAVALPTALAASPPTAHAAHTTTVTLKNISFIKSTVHIHKGDKVTWVWKDPTVPHNVTFRTRHSTTKQTGTYTITFHQAGTFNYHCTIHPGMDGKVIVR